MAIDKQTFWSKDNKSFPPPTTDLVQEAEQLLGVKLPVEFLALLEVQNGGYTRGFAYPMPQPTSWAPDYVPLDELFGVAPEADGVFQTILLTPYMTEEWELPEKQVLLCGDGHWWITLDYRQGPVPTVCWLSPDEGEDIQVAASFRAFLDGLVPADTFANNTAGD